MCDEAPEKAIGWIENRGRAASLRSERNSRGGDDDPGDQIGNLNILCEHAANGPVGHNPARKLSAVNGTFSLEVCRHPHCGEITRGDTHDGLFLDLRPSLPGIHERLGDRLPVRWHTWQIPRAWGSHNVCGSTAASLCRGSRWERGQAVASRCYRRESKALRLVIGCTEANSSERTAVQFRLRGALPGRLQSWEHRRPQRGNRGRCLWHVESQNSVDILGCLLRHTACVGYRGKGKPTGARVTSQYFGVGDTRLLGRRRRCQHTSKLLGFAHCR